MDPREPNIDRLLAALTGGKLDRCPNFEVLMDAEPVRYILDWPEPGGKSFHVAPADAVELARRTCQDAIMVPADYWGAGMGKITSPDDLAAIAPPDPAVMRERIAAAIVATAGTGIGVIIHTTSPFFSAYTTMGPVPIQSFMMNLYDDLPFVERLMDTHLAWQMTLLEEIRGLPISAIYVADDVAGTDGYFISPEMMQRLWVPRLARLMEVVRSFGLPVLFHCCGKLDDVLPILIEHGVDAIHPVQPSCNDIYAIRERYGPRLALVGNISIEGVLAHGTPGQVAADTREHIDRLGSAGYVVASSHSIVDAIPKENLFAMIDTAVEYGAH